MAYHEKSVEDVYKELKTSAKGLGELEAGERLREYGPNELVETGRVTPLQMFLDQFKDLMVVILIVAGVISLALAIRRGISWTNEDFIEACLIFAIVAINAVIGFIQEYKASRDLEALKGMLSKKCRVVRSGEMREVEARELVPGDIVVLEEGDIIPADGRILEAFNLKTGEAALTGESMPLTKTVEPVQKASVSVAEQRNMAFMGTVVARGRGRIIVTETGMHTEFGKIATLTQSIHEEPSPLQKELDEVAKFIAKIVLGICFVILLLNTLRGEAILHSFIFAVALAVAAVPEALPAIMTLTLAKGVRRMVRVNVIIRKLTSVETLGSTTVICSDKTGTLTKNEMTVQQLAVDGKVLRVTGVGYEPKGDILDGEKPAERSEELDLLVAIGELCNNAELRQDAKGWKILGDPTEGALTVLAAKAGTSRKELEKTYPRLAEIPFDSERKRMSTVHHTTKGHILFTKGAHSAVTQRCSTLLENGRRRRFTSADDKRIKALDEQMANQALRVLALAYRELPEKLDITSHQLDEKVFEQDLTFVGLVGMIDPPREGVKEAVGLCRRAGIRVFVITGDNGSTARAIARQIGIADASTPVVEGAHLDQMTDAELHRMLSAGEVIFARTLPKHKMHIVSILKKGGEVVAVTGDGVNDAPALKEANIGVAMGITGTDVSKEASDMVLVDDSFSSIVNAVREGRTIYDNIKKFLRYIISSNIGEVVAVVVSIFTLGIPPLTVPQILLVNLATDMFPALALGVEPPEKDIMERPPKSSKARIINRHDILIWISFGLVKGVGVFMVFMYYLLKGGYSFGMGIAQIEGLPTFPKALTLAFCTLVMYQIVNAFNCRSSTKSVFRMGLLTNISLWGAALFAVLLQIAVVHTALGQRLFGTVALSVWEWVIVFGVSLTILLYDEVRKSRLKDAVPAAAHHEQ